MEKLVANLSNKVRTATLQGREYLVAPVSMLMPGVFSGSAGPILYAEPDIKASVTAWNAKPITIGHPELPNGDKVSGCTPESLDRLSVGMILNTKYNGKSKKLQAEAWFDVARLSQVPGADTVHTALLANQKLEVSTGLIVEAIVANGTHEGKEFVATATNYKPDHLAIILDGEGAFSLKDGAGLLVNKSSKPARPERTIRLVGNAKSLLEAVEGVTKAVRDAYEVWSPDGPNTYVYIEDVTASAVIFEMYDSSGEEKYYQQNYEISDGEVTLVGELKPVTKKVTYSVQNKKQENMERKELISRLGETHAAFITNMTDDQFKAIESVVAKPEAPKAPEVLVVNSLDKLLSLAEAGLANQVKDAMAAAEATRTELIDTLVANQSQFTKEDLASFSSAHLSKLAKAVVPVQAPAKTPVYAGQVFVGNGKEEAVVETGFAPPSTL